MHIERCDPKYGAQINNLVRPRARRILHSVVLYTVLIIIGRLYGEPYYIRALRLRQGPESRAGRRPRTCRRRPPTWEPTRRCAAAATVTIVGRR
jgi:hypothetical protein